MPTLTGLLRELAPFIRQDTFIGSIVALLILWAVYSGYRLHAAAATLRQEFKDATSKVEQSNDAMAFVQAYEACAAEIARSPVLGGPWRGYSQTLIVPSRPGQPVTATADTRQWFDLPNLFRSVKSDPRYDAALPGMLVGAGLLFTFLGLAAALSAAGEVVAPASSPPPAQAPSSAERGGGQPPPPSTTGPSDPKSAMDVNGQPASGTGDQARRNAALQDLLGAASVKFITSLFGLFLSLVYARFRQRELRWTEVAFGRFLGALEERLPFRSAAFLQAEANQTLANQYAEVQRIGTDFFVNLGSTLEREFDQGLQQHIGPLAAAIESLTGKLANQNEDAMKAMLEAFLGGLQGSVGDSMGGTAATLEKLSSRLEGLQGGMDAAARKMGQAAEEMAAGMGRGSEAAMAGISEQMGTLSRTLREAADEAQRANRAAGDDLARQMAETASSLTRAAEGFQARIEEGAADGVNRLTGPLAAMLEKLSTLADAQRAAGAESSTALAATIARAAQALEQTAAKVADTLGGGAADASGRLVAATEAMRDDLRGVLEQFGVSLTASGAALTSGAKAGGDALLGAASALGSDLGGAATRLREAAEAAGTALREGGAGARAEIAEAGRTVGQATGALVDRVAGLGIAASTLADQAAALGRAARDVEAPLLSGATELHAAGEIARDTVTMLRDVAGSVRETVERVASAATALQDWQRGAVQLASAVGSAADRFEGLDQGLANTMRGLSEGLAGFVQQVTGFFNNMDVGLSRSIEGLIGIANSLEATASDLSDKK